MGSNCPNIRLSIWSWSELLPAVISADKDESVTPRRTIEWTSNGFRFTIISLPKLPKKTGMMHSKKVRFMTVPARSIMIIGCKSYSKSQQWHSNTHPNDPSSLTIRELLWTKTVWQKFSSSDLKSFSFHLISWRDNSRKLNRRYVTNLYCDHF